MTIKTALLSLQALLCSPEPGDPQDAQVAQMYLNDRSNFDATAKQWTQQYAMPIDKPAAVTRVCEILGCERPAAQAALEKAQWDETAAVNALLGG